MKKRKGNVQTSRMHFDVFPNSTNIVITKNN